MTTQVSALKMHKRLLSAGRKRSVRTLALVALLMAVTVPVLAAENVQSLWGDGPLSLVWILKSELQSFESMPQAAKDLFAGIGNLALTTQMGHANQINIWQEGISDRAYLFQMGSGNFINLTQQGDLKFSSILQFGRGNEAFVVQEGNENEVVIIQFGDQRVVNVLQGAGMTFRITQIGFE